MGEHKTPKLTVTITLALHERLALRERIRVLPPGDRDGERRWLRVWDALDFDGALKGGTMDRGGGIQFDVATLRKTERFQLDRAHVECLLSLPVAPTVEAARMFALVREQLEKAKETLG